MPEPVPPVTPPKTALPNHASVIEASVLVAYQAYQETMRQFLSAQERVMSELLSHSQPRQATPLTSATMPGTSTQGSSLNPTAHHLAADLRSAVERREFRIQYQPIVSLATGSVTGFEALLRWQHPERGLLTAAEFMFVAEETGLIIPIGQWVLRESCRQLASFLRQFPTNSPLALSINLSSKQFSQPDLIEQVDEILRQTGLDARNLRLEITESALMENAESAVDKLLQLKALGIELHMDDFGTGYSSLNSLHRFGISTLKIDCSFIKKLGVDCQNLKIVRAIVTLACDFGIDVIAEGVETAEQLEQLRALQCDYGQGYFFSKPTDCIVIPPEQMPLPSVVTSPKPVLPVEQFETMPRLVMQSQVEPLPEHGLLSLSGLFLITKDQLSVAPYVSEALEQRGARTAILTTSTLLEPEQLAIVIPHLRQIYGPVSGIVHLAALTAIPMAETLPNWRQTAQLQSKCLFQILHLCAEDLQQAGQKAESLICRVLAASLIGGYFSRGDRGGFGLPNGKSSNSLPKTLVTEWPDVQAKVIDFDKSLSPANIAQHIVKELLLPDVRLEVG